MVNKILEMNESDKDSKFFIIILIAVFYIAFSCPYNIGRIFENENHIN